MKRHTHPLTIFANLWRVLYLIIIPLIRGFLLALRGDLGSWVQGAWLDILVFLLMIALAVWRWWVVTYSFDDAEFTLNTGLLVFRQLRVAWDKVTTVSVIESFYLRPFGAARLRADTLAGSVREVDFTILLGREQAKAVLQKQRDQGLPSDSRSYVPKTSSILALALLTSNSLGGILFVSAFVSQSGKLLGNEFSDMLIGTFEEVARLLAFGIPPAAAAIGYMLLAGWFIGFLMTFVRYKNFAVNRSHSALDISGGIFTNREYCIAYNDINFIDIRQSITTKLLKLYSLYISAVGYGKSKGDISCIIPTENRPLFTLNRQQLFPAFSPSPRQVAPPKNGFMRFIGVAVSLCAAIPLATAVLIYFYRDWSNFILFVGLMSMVPALFFLIVRFFDYTTGGISKSGAYYTLRYSSGLYLHTVILPADKIVCIELKQSFIQKYSPNCDLIISTRAETRKTHHCRNLNKAALMKLFEM